MGGRRVGHPEKGRRELCQSIRVTYAFMRGHRPEFRVRSMCRVLRVQLSGFSAWLSWPLSDRATEDARLTKLIKALFVARRLHLRQPLDLQGSA